MPFSGTGRHRRTSRKQKNTAAAVAGAAGLGIALPLLASTTAHAASLSTWEAVAECESSGNWSIDTGNGFYGGLQFTSSTWAAYGGHAYAPQANQATKNQQITVAEKVLAGQGPGAWPVCGPKAGLTKGGPAPQLDPGSAADPAPSGSGSTDTAPAPSAGGQEQGHSGHGTAHHYRVARGDTLSKIARNLHVKGGWRALYQANRSVIGADPDCIRPGQNLVLGSAGGNADQTAEPAAPKPAAEPAAVKAAAPDTSAAPSTSGYTAPVNARVTTGYHVAGSSWASGYHTGLDFPVPTGTGVKAVTSGTVVSAGPAGAYGNQIVIKHPDGKYSQYAHLSSVTVSVGQSVTTGQVVGLSGATGNVTGPHLHFEIRTTPDYGSDVDPRTYLAAHGVTV